MKKVIKLLSAIIIFTALYSCSEDSLIKSDDYNPLLNERLIAPNGNILSKSIKQLNQTIFNGKVEIINLDYIPVPDKIKGFAVEITYLDELGNRRNIILIRDIKKIEFESSEISINDDFYGNNKVQGDIIVRCTGSGCCYAGGSFNVDSGNMTFFCKCEGNPEGNSNCTLSVTN